MDWGQCPAVTPCVRSSASKSGPKVPGRTSTTSEVVSTSTTPASAHRSSATPPKAGTDEPHTPERPAMAVTGTRAS